MKLFNDLSAWAGLHSRRAELLVSIATITALVFLSTQLVTGVTGLSVSLSILSLAVAIEVLRLAGGARQTKLDQLWPQVFDSFQNATQSGLSLQEQLGYLGQKGPIRLREHFARLEFDISSGKELGVCLGAFRDAIGSRHADQLALLIEVTTELGTAGVSESWRKAAMHLRAEQATFGEVLTKKGWVLGSAKVALIAPWLVAFVLVRLEQNRQAFETELGAVVLLFGLLLSIVAYAVVNKLGNLTLPGRIFNAAS